MTPSPTQNRHEQRLRALMRLHGLQMIPIGANGAVLIYGPGVYIKAARFRDISLLDLVPFVDH